MNFWLSGFDTEQVGEEYAVDDDLAWSYYRVWLMQQFGWTPAEVDEISQEDFAQIIRTIEVQHLRSKKNKKSED